MVERVNLTNHRTKGDAQYYQVTKPCHLSGQMGLHML